MIEAERCYKNEQGGKSTGDILRENETVLQIHKGAKLKVALLILTIFRTVDPSWEPN